MGVLIIRTIVVGGLCWGPPILGNYHIRGFYGRAGISLELHLAAQRGMLVLEMLNPKPSVLNPKP